MTNKIKPYIAVKNKKKLIICTMLLVLWVALMITLSSQNGSETATVSSGLAHKISMWIYGDKSTYIKVNQIHFIIRKIAHFVFFFVFSFIVSMWLTQFKMISLKKCIILSSCCTILFSFIDEWHKIFIPGRHFDLIDVTINVVGGLAALCIFSFVHKKQKQCKKN